MLNFKSIKTQLIIYLVCFAFFLSIKDKTAIFLIATGIAVISAVMAESGILYLRTKVFQITESSIITGLIVGYVLSSDEAWWKFLAASALAILSKYLIVFKKKHIFNPAALGIFLALVLLGASTQWNGTYNWYILLPFGIYFAQKIRKLEIIIGYFIVALTLFGIQAAMQKVPLWHIFGYLSYFYIFVMVIEPKTSPITLRGKFFFGAGIAALIFIFTELGIKFDAELFSLLILNTAVLILNKKKIK
jgi:Na+-translocating ferredoxin:NAD+ oxidoreductase RnfD subunit